jgi:hypothetical protein
MMCGASMYLFPTLNCRRKWSKRRYGSKGSKEVVQEEAQEEQGGLQQQGHQEDLEKNHKKNKKSLSQHKELQDMSHEVLLFCC